ncbi:uncharacterized protein LOC111085193 [Limulus polyphemus]|uniref:Uncharacterized protein LOC111085193 n=1 Tax=Limulus polyphemus TaxID=6850 RepID=A0ABM1S433_LIMPO|nr:uncharacterized protein LOC111085193 [Limulus polyphemus]
MSWKDPSSHYYKKQATIDLQLRITGNQMRLSPSRIPVIQRYSTDHPRSQRHYQPDVHPSSRAMRFKMKASAQSLICDFNNSENTFLTSNTNQEEYRPYTNLNIKDNKVVTEGKTSNAENWWLFPPSERSKCPFSPWCEIRETTIIS